MNIYEEIKKGSNLKESDWMNYQIAIENLLEDAKESLGSDRFAEFCEGIINMCQNYMGDLNQYEESDKELKESVYSTPLDKIKELAGYLQDFIDGCEERGMTELQLEGSHLAGDCLSVAGSNGGYISLTSDFSYDDDEIFNEYKVV